MRKRGSMVRRANPLRYRKRVNGSILPKVQARRISIPTITAVHCRELSAKLVSNGVTEVLVDKRKGQKQDFRVDLSVKAELIQHFAARAVTGHSTSSQALTEIINDSQKTTISPRTIRWLMSKLGLMKIKKTLPNLGLDKK